MSYEQIAAVDLGSNSFHLEIGRVVYSQIYPLDILKEPVRLASGLGQDKHLDEASQTRALATLARFGERLRGFQPASVRAVATNTLRVARNAGAFLSKAEQTLGFPIEVIAGHEEARLIYLGAAHALPPTRDRRLVIDIGGGSTEFIIGKQIEPMLMESLYMGCVSYSLRFFPDGRVDKKRFVIAELSAAREMQRIAQAYRQLGWSEAAASSGTARAVADLLEMNSLNPDGEEGITRAGVEKLRGLLIRAGSAANLGLSGLRSERVPVLAGGLAILSAVFSELSIERMIYSEGALRLGVLYDLLGRFHRRDMRDTTVRRFMRRYQVDVRQASRVRTMALAFFSQLVDDLDAQAQERGMRLLAWAASLHEIGISISHSGFHKHGAYITRFADMPGFSKTEQERLSFLILGQRGKLEKLITVFPTDDLCWRLVFCLRLAALLHRSRDDYPAALDVRIGLRRDLKSGKVKASGKHGADARGGSKKKDTEKGEGKKGGNSQHGGSGMFSLSFPVNWLAANPLSVSALAEEAQIWQRVGFGLTIKRRSTAGRAG